MELGTPTGAPVDAFSQVVLSPDEINVSSDASVPTRVTFPSPIHLAPAREYCIVLLLESVRAVATRRIAV